MKRGPESSVLKAAAFTLALSALTSAYFLAKAVAGLVVDPLGATIMLVGSVIIGAAIDAWRGWKRRRSGRP